MDGLCYEALGKVLRYCRRGPIKPELAGHQRNCATLSTEIFKMIKLHLTLSLSKLSLAKRNVIKPPFKKGNCIAETESMDKKLIENILHAMLIKIQPDATVCIYLFTA